MLQLAQNRKIIKDSSSSGSQNTSSHISPIFQSRVRSVGCKTKIRASRYIYKKKT